MTRLGELMTGAVVAVAPEDTLGEAAERMAAEGVGSSVVLDGGRLIGILTERDLLGAVAGRVHTSEARVREWMTGDPVTASESMSVDEAIVYDFTTELLRLQHVADDTYARARQRFGEPGAGTRRSAAY